MAGLVANSIFTFLAGAGVGVNTATIIANTIVQLGASALLTAASNAFARGKVKQPDIKRELSLPTTTPAYRFVYGVDRAAGTPAPIRVRAGNIYGCWLLNSRPSDLGDLTLYLDKRAVTLSGDPFDFDGPGATATNAPFAGFVRVWFGRGDQTSPPATILSEAPWAAGADEELFLPTDGWEGRTVMWAILAKGTGNTYDRWPSQPPLVEVEAKWSLVCDITNPAHDFDDPATWAWSENQTLCVLDALRMNPIEAYRDTSLLLDSFAAGALIAAEAVPRLTGGSEPRYAIGGTLVFDSAELEDQLQPLMTAGAASFARVGGALAFVPGAFTGSAQTVTGLLEPSLRYSDMKRGAELPNELLVQYTSRARGYEAAELAPWPIPGALAEDGGVPKVQRLDLPFVTSPTQAMRLRQIAGRQSREQRRIEAIGMPAMLDCIAGSVVSLDLPSPYGPLNGTYLLTRINPAVDLVGSDGVAMRCPFEAVSTSAAIYAWVPATDQEPVTDPVYIEGVRTVALPGVITATTGPGVALGSVPRIRFAFDPSPTTAVLYYEWQWRAAGGEYEAGGTIDALVRDGSDQVFGHLGPVLVGTVYDMRVRAVAPAGTSDWRELTGTTAVGPTVDLAAPANGTATPAAGQITVTYTTPNSADFEALEIWVATTNSSAAASLLFTVYGAQNTLLTRTQTGLGSGATRFYFGRSRGPYNSVSAFTASMTATTP